MGIHQMHVKYRLMLSVYQAMLSDIDSTDAQINTALMREYLPGQGCVGKAGNSKWWGVAAASTLRRGIKAGARAHWLELWRACCSGACTPVTHGHCQLKPSDIA